MTAAGSASSSASCAACRRRSRRWAAGDAPKRRRNASCRARSLTPAAAASSATDGGSPGVAAARASAASTTLGAGSTGAARNAGEYVCGWPSSSAVTIERSSSAATSGGGPPGPAAASVPCAVASAPSSARPAVRGSSTAAKRGRRLPDQVVAALGETGALTLSRPARYRGAEADLQTQLAALVEGAEGPPEPLIAMVPMEQLEIVDDWDPSGLAGTGSATVRCEDVFVPAYRTLSTVAALQGRYASEANRDRPLFRTAFFPFVLVASTGAAVGMAQGAMDVFLERLPGRMISYTHYTDQAQAPVTHLQVAEASARTRAAELLARDLSRQLDEAAAEGRDLTVAERAAVRGEVGLVVRECRTAVEILADASGASSIQKSVPIQRICRDIRALSIHAALNLTTNLEVHGRVLVGA